MLSGAVLGDSVLGVWPAQVQHLQPPPVDYGAIAPILIVFSGACLSVLVEAFASRPARWLAQVVLTLLTLGAAGAALGLQLYSHGASNVLTLAGTIAVDGPSLFLWGTLLALGLAAMLLIADRTVEPGGAFTPDAALRPGTAADRAVMVGTRTETVMQTEIFPLFLFSLGGMMVFVAANDLLTMFIALEVLSLPLYLMSGMARRRRLLSQEAAVKYFLLGAFSSAFFLYGVALLYGYAGSVQLSRIAEASAAVASSRRVPAVVRASAGWLMILRVLSDRKDQPKPADLPWSLVLGGGLLAGPVAGVLLGLMCVFSSGSLGDGRMAMVGPDPWQVGLVATAVVAVSTTIGAAAGRIFFGPSPKN